jgi:hypothetical protein
MFDMTGLDVDAVVKIALADRKRVLPNKGT